ncbi:MAG: hypothetical protein ACYC46_03575 [Acidobacteriaceae bacterium]
MKLCRFTLLLSLFFLPLIANAQTGIYATFSAAKLSQQNTDWMYGPTVGLYSDTARFGFFSTGFDVRGTFLSGGGNSLNSLIVGPRLAIRPRVIPIQPYAQVGLGFGHATFGQGSGRTTTTKFEYQFLGGLDMTVLPRVDWRVVEFSYGGLSDLNGSFNPKTISSGIVFRLP